MIRKAEFKDIERILTITKACAKKMVTEGIFQWNEHYPNKDAFYKDVENGELYVLVQENVVIGCIVISTIKDDVYNDVEWLTREGRHIYIHRFAIHPEKQGKGHAQELMTFAEHLAETQNFDSVRLDTFSQNKRNQRFYEQRGYKRLGEIYFPKQSEHSFYCYEFVF